MAAAVMVRVLAAEVSFFESFHFSARYGCGGGGPAVAAAISRTRVVAGGKKRGMFVGYKTYEITPWHGPFTELMESEKPKTSRKLFHLAMCTTYGYDDDDEDRVSGIDG
nr:hypothetical protein Iba_chr05cCG13940 [Ipomoea batatas]GME20514.1 hypothetical protein Iba_scaffold25351CG0010 [Ipomoea batatas]